MAVALIATAVAHAPERAAAAAPTVSFTPECRFGTTHAWWRLSATWDVTALDEEFAIFFDTREEPAHRFPANQQSSWTIESGYMPSTFSWEVRDPAGVVVQAGEYDDTECLSRPAFTGDAAADPGSGWQSGSASRRRRARSS